MILISLKKILFRFLPTNSMFLFIFLFFSFYSCGNKELSTYDQIEYFFNENYQFNHLNEYNYLVVINEKGDCMNCNNSFSLAMSKNIKKSNVLFLISSPGYSIDISSYTKDKKHNVFYDYREKFNELNLINHSAIFIFNNNKVDSIIQINSSNLNNQIDFPFN